MKILVTGAAGFIGGYLYRELKKQRYNVVGIDNFSNACSFFDNSEIIKTDFAEHSGKYDYIFHLAAKISVDESLEYSEEYYDNNFIKTKDFLENNKKSKIIYASTSEVYGTAQYEPMDEKHPLCPQSPYGLSKLMADHLCQLLNNVFNRPVKVVRNFNIYGYGQSILAFIPRAIYGLQADNKIQIYGDGTQVRDYTRVEDCVANYISYIEEWENKTVVSNFSRGCIVSIKDIANELIRLNGSGSIETINPRTGEVYKLHNYNSKKGMIDLKDVYERYKYYYER